VATIIGTCTSVPFRLNSPLRLKSIHASTRPLLYSCSSVGAICGGTSAGFTSQYLGRRLTIIIYIVSVGAFIPLWILPKSFPQLAAGAFCVQFFVQGAWGVIPIQLAELSPADFRATFPGLMYQLGNMVASASAQIEALGGEHLHIELKGKEVPDYAKVQGMLLGTVAAFTILVTFLGPENHASHFEDEEGSSQDDAYSTDRPTRRYHLGGKIRPCSLEIHQKQEQDVDQIESA